MYVDLVDRHWLATDLHIQEMKSEERRAADQKIKAENLFKSLGAGEQEAETEGFQCGRCKQASLLLFSASSI